MRGDIVDTALQLLKQGGPVEVRGVDLKNQTLEHAANQTEIPIFLLDGKSRGRSRRP